MEHETNQVAGSQIMQNCVAQRLECDNLCCSNPSHVAICKIVKHEGWNVIICVAVSGAFLCLGLAHVNLLWRVRVNSQLADSQGDNSPLKDISPNSQKEK